MITPWPGYAPATPGCVRRRGAVPLGGAYRCDACGWTPPPYRQPRAGEAECECRLSLDGWCAGTVRTASARDRARIRRAAMDHGAGAWWWQIAPRGDRTLHALVPAPRAGWGWVLARLPILPEHLHGLRPGWRWDRDEAAPTLDPSILVRGAWHGWLQAGRWVSV